MMEVLIVQIRKGQKITTISSLLFSPKKMLVTFLILTKDK